MMQVVFICTGNICRSPTAEGILHKMWSDLGYGETVSSMGISGLDHSPATENAQQVCREHGIDISSHRSRPLLGEELQKANFIFCMEPVHKRHLETFFPWYKERVFLLGAWPEKETRKSVIKDPMGGSIDLYRQIFDVIHHHIHRILPML